MVEILKHIAGAAGSATPPCTFMFGTVVSTEPLAVQVDSRFFVGENALVLMKQFRKGGYNTHKHGIVDKDTGAKLRMETDETDEEYCGLNVGDKLVLLREHGGQRFLVLGVID